MPSSPLLSQDVDESIFCNEDSFKGKKECGGENEYCGCVHRIKVILRLQMVTIVESNLLKL